MVQVVCSTSPGETEKESPPQFPVKKVLPNGVDAEDEAELRIQPKKRSSSGQSHPSLSFLLHTRLIRENLFDKRFSAVGGEVLLSVPIAQLFPQGELHVESGVIFTLSRLSLNQPDITFTHIFFEVPIHLRLVFPISQTISGAVFAGANFKLVEYDSRPTSDGGIHFVDNIVSQIDPDLGVGLLVRVSPSVGIRAIASYLFLGAGIEITF